MVVLVERVVRRRHAERFVDTHVPSLLVVLAAAAVVAVAVVAAVGVPGTINAPPLSNH